MFDASLDGRRFRAVSQVDGGEVGTETIFEYHQDGDLVWARYAGGRMRLHETWRWESRAGQGTSVVEEIAP